MRVLDVLAVLFCEKYGCDPEDVEMLEDLLAAAVNEAVRVVKETQETEMGKVTAGISLPAGLF